MLPQKIFKIRIFNLAENELQTTKFPDFWISVANSLTFGFLSQIPWLFRQIPWLFQVFQVSGNPAKLLLFSSFSTGSVLFPSGSVWAMALLAGRAVWCWLFTAKTRLIKCGWYASGSSGIQMSALELGKSWGIALVLIMKYLLKKPSKIFSLRINAKCLKNNLNN